MYTSNASQYKFPIHYLKKMERMKNLAGQTQKTLFTILPLRTIGHCGCLSLTLKPSLQKTLRFPRSTFSTLPEKIISTSLSLSKKPHFLSLKNPPKMWDYFPQDALVSILSKLSVKSLLRFRCVCKSWNFLITTNPSFISAHLRHSSAANTHLLIKYFCAATKCEVYSLRSDSDSLVQLGRLKCPFKTHNDKFFRSVGSVNGLICLSDDQFSYTNTIIVCVIVLVLSDSE